ncbi:MAG: hypothetical protein QGG34_03070 [SAR202 cluster bacterium]|nr:hypothetical protein [SAR202 cluster bacterium]MDP6302461.1 hypothetical protein [SAR202 cluster bacterium]MDP7223728.1 hypothetical protein [SAR202 cluster bacterium]MDP7412170.1 hypothetical protein [SAR202 cluster bacterium]
MWRVVPTPRFRQPRFAELDPVAMTTARSGAGLDSAFGVLILLGVRADP